MRYDVFSNDDDGGGGDDDDDAAADDDICRTLCPSVDSSDHGPYTSDERAYCINCPFQFYIKFIILMTLCKLSMQTVEFCEECPE